MPTKNISPCDEFTGNAGGQLGELIVQERGKSIEVGKRIDRPLDRYWPGHRLNPGVASSAINCGTVTRLTTDSSAMLLDHRQIKQILRPGDGSLVLDQLGAADDPDRLIAKGG